MDMELILLEGRMFGVPGRGINSLSGAAFEERVFLFTNIVKAVLLLS
jgi:hypothetical protein